MWGDPSQKCHFALSPESILLPCKCVPASIPIPGSLWEWQECQGDVNGDIRSQSPAGHRHRAGGAVSCRGRGVCGGQPFLWLTDVCSQVRIECVMFAQVRVSVRECVRMSVYVYV